MLTSWTSLRKQAFRVNAKQSVLVNHLKDTLHARSRYYSSVQCFNDVDVSDEDDVVVQDPEMDIEERPPGAFFHHDWRKIILVTGKPGTGKTQAMLVCIDTCSRMGKNVLVATPTGFLATRYRSHFNDNVSCDTVHSTFSYPVLDSSRPTINWTLATFDLVVLDEISMIPWHIFSHILNTLAEITVRPVVLASGDKAQRQPIQTIPEKIVAMEVP